MSPESTLGRGPTATCFCKSKPRAPIELTVTWIELLRNEQTSTVCNRKESATLQMVFITHDIYEILKKVTFFKYNALFKKKVRPN